MLKPVERSSVIQQVVNEIRQFIIERRLKDGTRLPSEHELCRRLRVSRPTVREALKVLETLGLVERTLGGGPLYDALRDRTGPGAVLYPT